MRRRYQGCYEDSISLHSDRTHGSLHPACCCVGHDPRPTTALAPSFFQLSPLWRREVPNAAAVRLEGNELAAEEIRALAEGLLASGSRKLTVDIALDRMDEALPALSLWRELVSVAEQFDETSMMVNGIEFSYGPFPDEEGKGTLIVFPDDFPFSDLQHFNTALLDAFIPDRREKDGWCKQGEVVRLHVPADTARRILRYAYRKAVEARRKLERSEYKAIEAWHRRLQENGTLSSQEIEELTRLHEVLLSKRSGYLTFIEDVGWMGYNLVAAQRIDSIAIENALHDSCRRQTVWKAALSAISNLKRGRAVFSEQLSYFHLKSGLLVGDVISEGEDLAFPERAAFNVQLIKGKGDHLTNAFLLQDDHVLQLVDIIANLVSNGARYRDDTKAEHFVARSAAINADGSIEISVVDNGIGIEPANLVRLGEHGYREERLAVEGSHGFGLSSAVATLHTLGFPPLRVRSLPGIGTEFVVTIPRGVIEWRGEPPSFEVRDASGEGGPLFETASKLSQLQWTEIRTQ